MTMKEWLANEFYNELIQIPLWTLSAFGFLQEGDVLKSDDSRYKLIIYLVMKHIHKVPAEFYETEFRHNWSVSDFIPCIKAAVKHSMLS